MNVEATYAEQATLARNSRFSDELGHVAPGLQRRASKLQEAAARAQQQLDDAQAQARTEIDALQHLLSETGRRQGKLTRAEDLLRLATAAAAAVDLPEVASFDDKRLPSTLEMLSHSAILERHLPPAIDKLRAEIESGIQELVVEFKRQSIEPRTFFDRLSSRVEWLTGTSEVVAMVEDRLK